MECQTGEGMLRWTAGLAGATLGGACWPPGPGRERRRRDDRRRESRAKIGTAFALTGPARRLRASPAQRRAAGGAGDQRRSHPRPQAGGALRGRRGDKAAGTNVFQKFINQDKVLAIMGPTLSDVALAADPIAQQAGVPVQKVSNTATGANPDRQFHLPRLAHRGRGDPQHGEALKDKLGLKRVAILYGNDDAFTQSGYEGFKKALDANQ